MLQRTRVTSFLAPLLALAPWLMPVAALSVAAAPTPGIEEYAQPFGCDGGGWPEGGGGWEDWTDMIAETGCTPEMYDYYMLPDASTPAEPSTAETDSLWGPGDDAPAIAPDNCDFYDSTNDPWIYLSWGCG